jgi:hypothetical protein
LAPVAAVSETGPGPAPQASVDAPNIPQSVSAGPKPAGGAPDKVKPGQRWSAMPVDFKVMPASTVDDVNPEWTTRPCGDAVKVGRGAATAPALTWFRMVHPDMLLDRIVDATNLEGQRRYAGTTPSGRKRRSWRPIDRATLARFLALVIMMGVHTFSHIRHYWSRVHPALGARKCFRTIMSSRRFMAIRASLRFSFASEAPAVRSSVVCVCVCVCVRSGLCVVARAAHVPALLCFVAHRYRRTTCLSIDSGRCGHTWTQSTIASRLLRDRVRLWPWMR